MIPPKETVVLGRISSSCCYYKMTDWENREFVESIRLHMQRLAHYMSDLDRKTRAHLAVVEQRLDVLERKLEQLDGGLDRSNRKLGDAADH